GIGTDAIKALNQGTGPDLLPGKDLFFQPGLGEKEISTIHHQVGVLFCRQTFNDGCFPGQTAQRSTLSPTGLDLALHVPRSHDLEDGGLLSGIAPATP
ncbi:unnamed protein product, partial [marine sediment metagenome]